MLVVPLSNLGREGGRKRERVEGRSREIIYDIPQGHDAHEVFRSYEAALTRQGFRTLYSCMGQAGCDSSWPLYIQSTYNMRMSFIRHDSQRYLAAKRTAPDGDTWVMLYVVDDRHLRHARALLNIVDVAPLKEGLVTVSAEAMAKGISDMGHVAVYGVHFDVDRADLAPESAGALKEMAALLEREPTLTVAIVGHTDNAGKLDHNLSLSERRADAVMKALVSQYGIDARRLTSKGVGPFSPVASNRTEDGRARNRRVELVER
jgi:outer membrane protein OmpA-like peptidoglycan-associated protein